MKFYLTAFLLAFAALVPFTAVATMLPDITERATPFDSPEYSKEERELSVTYPAYFTINKNSIKITLLEVAEEQDMNYVRLQEQPPKDLNGIIVTIDSIVNVASKIWDIVQQNAPVANLDTKYANAYPSGITSASQLAQWSRPKSYSYGFYAENLYGSIMIDCKYKVSFAYNGAYKGKGKYLTGVAVIPTKAQVGWGYKFYMSAAVPDSTIANVGTEADPVAAMQLKLSWKMATALKETNGTSVYYVQGDGAFEEIASPWKVQMKVEDIGAASPLLEPEKVF